MTDNNTCRDCHQPLAPDEYPERCKACWAHKAAMQTAKEEKLPFPKLCAKLRQESETAARQARRRWQPPHASLFGPFGDYQVVEGYVCTMTSGVTAYGPKVPKERLYPLAEFWTRVMSGTHHL